MAVNTIVLYNPTAATVTVNAQSVPAHQAVKLSITDTTTDLDGFVLAGCVAMHDGTRSTLCFELEEAGFYINRNHRALQAL